MFKKLLSNLPFNPSLIGEVAFYAKRMHGEEAVRRAGFVFIALAVLLQVFAIASPPEQTLAESNNDVLRGGFTTREQAVAYCRTNKQDFSSIMAYYQVSCDALATASTQMVRSTDYNKQLHSMGRVPQGARIARTGKPTNEYLVMINGTEYSMKNLWAWDSGASSTYKMLVVKNTRGQTIRIMYTCGNIVTEAKYTPPPPPAPPKKPTPPKDVCLNIPGIQLNREECDVCTNIPGEQTNKSECYPCPEARENHATTACLELQKNASNQTRNIPDANGKDAGPNDIIIYSLTSKNAGTQTVEDFVVEENMSDVLEYATIVDLHGGQLNDKDIVSWPQEDIPPGTTLAKQITVKVKGPVPQTPVSASDPGSFDLVMTNVYYGNSVHVRLPASIAKTAELGVSTMPETGPGTTLVLAFAITGLTSYFFARSRLLARELDIVRTDFTSTGGM
ncbi:MAG TPA: hypothetical protein VK674_06745 [Candidatus Limnocylindria bacterium]|nr:hypothetical protein [Candidatus Limnocylindria bacterium]